MNEFELIARYFSRPAVGADLGVGDDAALMTPTPGHQLVVSSDMLVAGRHFLADTDPSGLGHKSLAVNLSDLAAMGAKPRWVLLSLALPGADEAWIQHFSEGFYDLAERYGVSLVGGDTTKGPLTINVTIMGEVPNGMALRRDGAQPGDDIWVSGHPGLAAAGLAILQAGLVLPAPQADACLDRLLRPVPRIELGLALPGVASAAIDVSDGLAADLGHILERSQVGAYLNVEALPMLEQIPLDRMRHFVLAGGDDYELCFTAATSERQRIEALSQRLAIPLSRIGSIVAQPGLILLDGRGQAIQQSYSGFDHFA